MKSLKKSHKAFTLIELLAIIVILAIIAVITVPIILNIIENSRKGAATDSAHGYKDAIQKYYLSKLSEDKNWNKLDGNYTINDGTLIDKENSTNVHNINVSGTIPNGGELEIVNNIIKSGCIQIGDYKVEVTNNEIGSAIKGICTNSTTQKEIEKEQYVETYGPSITEDSCFTYTVNNNKVTITGLDSTKTNCGTSIIIPTTISIDSVDRDVTEIGPGAFVNNSQITSVIMPPTIEIINAGAFMNTTALTTAIIGNNTATINNAAFSNSGIQSITIPDSVTTLGQGVFNNCSSLQTLIISNNITQIQTGFCAGCSSLTEINIPEGVTIIGGDAPGGPFANCTSLTSIRIPQSVVEIKAGAFSGDSALTTLILSKNIEKIGASAFSNPNTITVYYEGTATDWNNIDIDSTAFAQTPTINYNYEY